MAGHTQRQWEGKFFRCGMRCFYCLKPLMLKSELRSEQATKDHLTPRSRGGNDLIGNIVSACFDCNQRKGQMTEEEFRKIFSTAFKLLAGVAAANTATSVAGRNFSMIDQPDLSLIRKESETTSWAWRNPPVERKA